MEDNKPSPSVDARMEKERFYPVRVALVGLFLMAIFYTLYFARSLLLPVALAVLLSLVLSPAVRGLRRVGIAPPFGAALIVLSLIGSIGFGVYSLVDPATRWLQHAPQTLHNLEIKLRKIKKPVQRVQAATQQVSSIAQVDNDKKPTPVVIQENGVTETVLASTQNILFNGVTALILLYFLLASGNTFLRKLVHVLPRFSDKVRAVEVAHAIEHEVSHYLFTITYINAGLGLITAVAMFLLGMPNPALWGGMVALLNFIPYLGAGVNLVVLTLVAILSFDSLTHAALVPLTFLSLATLEGQIVTPMVLGQRLTLNPVIIFLALMLWGWMWGIPGMLIAVPFLVTLKIISNRIPMLLPLAEFLNR